jgi:hypothetical protein
MKMFVLYFDISHISLQLNKSCKYRTNNLHAISQTSSLTQFRDEDLKTVQICLNRFETTKKCTTIQCFNCF